jgi:hypothetical protein
MTQKERHAGSRRNQKMNGNLPLDSARSTKAFRDLRIGRAPGGRFTPNP